MSTTLQATLERLRLSGSAVPDLCATGVQEDSRKVSPGDIFVAVAGLTVDGHEYAAQAAAAGAVAVVGQRPISWPAGVAPLPCILVEDSVRALGLLSSALHGKPTERLSLTGITGTNGKSTTAYLLRSILDTAGRQAGLIGTIEYGDGVESVPAPYTTPSAPQLQQWLARMVAAGSSHAVMEVSSHGLQLGRTWGCEFDVAAFSNLTQDHLDLHGDMDRYLQAKLLLFSRHLRSGGSAVVNLDGAGSDEVAKCVEQRGDVRLVSCSSSGRPASVQLLELEQRLEGLSATLVCGEQRLRLQSQLVGAFNAENMLLAAGCAHALGVPVDAIAAGIRQLAGVPGRLERVPSGDKVAVFVDYAHTPDALARALDVLRPLCQGRLVVVFGCGGDRDRTKRPLMGQAAAARADLVLVTSDNPRSEEPGQILAEIEPAVAAELPALSDAAATRTTDSGYLVQSDRAAAIDIAVGALRAGDVLLVAGKGHETYQLVGSERLAFDDREQARLALQRHGA